MPSRLMTAAILLFWLSMTGWLIQREVVPMMLAEISPTYQIDLTDEIGSPQVDWTIYLVTHLNGKASKEEIGQGESKIQVNDDRTYEFRSSLRFLKPKKFMLGPLQIKRLESTYRVTEEGKLLSLAAKASVSFPFQEHPLSMGIKGEVLNGFFEPCLFGDGFEQKLEKIDLAQQGNIINPMHPVNRLRGLRPGQIWKINLLDPLRGTQKTLVGDLGKQGMMIPSLIAEVKLDKLFWDRKEVVCYKIEYYEPGKEVTARTWVRRSDGLVLQQEASHFGYELISERKS